MTYTRHTYTLQRFAVCAPAITNAGDDSFYAESVGEALESLGFTGWTERPYVGVWYGKREQGTEFEVYADPHKLSLLLADGTLSARLRAAMPDQDAIQVVVDPHPATLIEA